MKRLFAATALSALVGSAVIAGCSNTVKDATYGITPPIDAVTAPPDPGPGPIDPTTPELPEDDFLALPPAQTDAYVFVTNPARNTVTRIHVQSLQVRTTPVGADPRIVETTPDYRTAVVFNHADDTVSLVDAETLETRTVEVRRNLNRMAISPDGRWAALWFDRNAVEPDDPPIDGSQSYNEMSFVDTISGEHFGMAVGFEPRSISFTPDASLCVMISDASLAMVDLTATPLQPELITLSTELEPPAAEELVLVPDGSFAFVRQFGATSILVVDLQGRAVDEVPTGDTPTDLDVTPDGRTAVVVARGDRELWLYDVANPYVVSRIVPLPPQPALGAVLIDPTGTTGLVYTTVGDVDTYASWDLATDAITVRPLVKPVTNMVVTPTGGTVLAFHTLTDAPDADPYSPFFGNWALTLIDLSDFRTNPLLLPAEPSGYANSTNGLFGYFIMDGEPFLEVLDYTTLLHEQVVLSSQPVYVGVLPDLDPGDGDEPQAWASQDHPLGRITFYDADTTDAETITGFELNGGID